MAPPSKLFLTTTVAPYAPPAPDQTYYDGDWNSGYTNAVTLSTVAAGVVTESKKAAPTTPADYDFIFRRGVLDPGLLGGGLFGGTVKIQMMCRETNTGNNAFLHAHICTLKGATPTVGGVLLRDHIGSVEFPVSTSVRSIVATGELQLQTVETDPGDLILAELGFRSNSTLATYEAACEFGGSAVWLEFSGLDGRTVVDLSVPSTDMPRFRGAVTSSDPLAGSTAESDYLPVPDNLAIGDVVVAMAFVEPTGKVITPPPGFLEAPNSPVDLAAGFSQRIWWKRLDAVDTGLYTFTWTGITDAIAAVLLHFDNCTRAGVPMELLTSAAKASQGTAGTVSPAVSGTTTGPARLWLHTVMDYASVRWSAYTQSFLESIDDNFGQAAAVKGQTVAGVSGSVTATATASGKMTAWLGALIGPSDVTVAPVSIASAESWGQPSVSVQPVELKPLSISSAEAWGLPAVAPGPVTLGVVSIQSAELWGQPALSDFGTTLKPESILSQELWGQPVVTPGPVFLDPVSILSEELWSEPDLTIVGALAPSFARVDLGVDLEVTTRRNNATVATEEYRVELASDTLQTELIVEEYNLRLRSSREA